MSLQCPEFKFVTDGCLQEWKASNSNFKLSEPVSLIRFLYELCWAMIRGDLPLQKCKLALDSVTLSDGNKNEMGSTLVDIIAHMGQDLTMPVEYRNRLTKMAKLFAESLILPSRLLQERCEEEFLWESELSRVKAHDLKSKEVRINTRLLYQQTKFNLLREESEGYSKLVTLLCQNGLDTASQSTSYAIISIIKSLIGHFDLDPNRVFDIVLECFELYHDNSIFYNLIPIFPKSHAAQILGFKFQYYQRIEVSAPVPFGLYQLAASLVKSGFVNLDSICVHLLPKDEEAFEHYNGLIAKRFEEANKIGKINLAATGKDLMEDEKQDVTVDLFTALDMESEAVMEHAAEVENNQSFGLLIGFLSINDWYHAQVLFDRLSCLNPVAHVLVCEGLFRAIKRSISPAYEVICQTRLGDIGNFVNTCSDIAESAITSILTPVNISKDLFQMLAAAGPYLHRDTILLQKVCRVLKAYYLSAQESLSVTGNLVSNVHGDVSSKHLFLRAKEARLKVEEALGTCLLPSLQLIPANPAIGQEIWEVLSLLPYEARYRLYGEWEKEDERIPMVLAARQIAKLDTRRILKRLAKENLKQLGRMVAKLAHSNPMTVLRTIVHQIEAYKDMIAPVVDAFKYLTQLEYDILEYVVIERLAQGGRDKLKDDGLNLSDWLQSLASFWGHLCKKYPSMELRGLFQYLVNQLKKGTGVELVLLQELIQQMANVQYTENMTEEQLDSMAGSETLRFQATLFGMARNNKALSKSTMRLRDSLLPKEEPKLAIPLLLLIAQHRSLIVIHADAPYIKMVSEQFDRCHGMLLQYVDFLTSAIIPTSTYAQLIPCLNDLVHQYHLDPEVAFLIYRPIMRLFKCASSPDVFWPLDLIEESLLASEANDIDEKSSTDVVLDLGTPRNPIMWSDLLETVRSMFPVKAWNSLSPDLYATFWGLTLYDLYVPRNRYEAEITKQHAAIKALEELSDNSNMAITKRKKDKERIQELLDRLAGELQKHEQHVTSVRHRLRREKDKWLSSCPDTLKINMEFLQRCIFPRCIFSMPDAVYCAKFVHMLHSLGTPFFNTVNHIDVLICKTLQPMICCCTEYEAGRLGRFLYETLKMAYYWKSDESVYERECGNMPGFAVYYRYPNSQRVAYGQFVRVHWKWSGRMTRLLVQCLESTEYMEIRNALIMLTKISNVFPVTRKSGLNLEKRVTKIKGDEREDLKVLATGVAAALAARKSSWVSEEEFGMGYVDHKPAASPAKTLTINLGSLPNGSNPSISQNDLNAMRSSSAGNLVAEHTGREQIVSAKSTEGRPERSESSAPMKSSDLAQPRQRGTPSTNGLPAQASLPSSHQSIMSAKTSVNLKIVEELNRVPSLEPESKSQFKRSAQNSLGKQTKQEVTKEDVKSGKSIARAGNQASASSDRDSAHPSDGRQTGSGISATANNTNLIQSSGRVSASPVRTTDVHSGLLRAETGAVKPSDNGIEVSESSRSVSVRTSHSPLHDDPSKLQKKTVATEEQDRVSKRRKGDSEGKDDYAVEARLLDKAHLLDHERTTAEQYHNKSAEKLLEKMKEKSTERFEKDHKEKLDQFDINRGEDFYDKSRDKSMERNSRERSVERMPDRSLDRPLDKTKDDKGKPRHSDPSADKSDERFLGQNLPPPPPLPLSFVPQSVGGNRRDDDADRKSGTARNIQRLSPKHDDKDRKHSEENVSQDDVKRRRDGISLKVDERDREKGIPLKDDLDTTASKRRKLKRDHLSESGGDYSTAMPPPSSLAMGMSQPFDARERGDRKVGGMIQHRAAAAAAYTDEQGLSRLHGKETAGKTVRREADQLHEREWEEEKRQRTEAKRKHRK